jgi:eukaryotic-like serine/threonine-protein kinase
MKILIADDDPILQILLTRKLTAWGYEVTAVSDGNAAWEEMQKLNAPRLVILDWMMPGIDGPALCRKLRQSPSAQYVYIVMLTGRTQKEDMILGIDSGADAFLTKPVNFDELKSRLSAAQRVLAHQCQIMISKTSPTLKAVPVAEVDDAIVAHYESQVSPDLTRDPMLALAPRKIFGRKYLPSLGRVLLLNKLGEGGMGAVYRGYHPRLRIEVAVKVLSPRFSKENTDAATRFYREAQIAALVKSSYLVGVLDVDQENGTPFLVMDMVDGCSAADLTEEHYMEKKKGLPEAKVLDICIAAVKGLAAAHNSGIIHRDIKPDNIMVPYAATARDGVRRPVYQDAKLADLGIARFEGDNEGFTTTNTSLGTLGYMAPEQIRDAKHVGKTADIFGMGATLYALLAVRVPFTGNSAYDVFTRTVSQPHEPIRKYVPELSGMTAAIIDTCLEKNPAMRYPDANALLEDLQYSRNQIVNAPAGCEAVAVEA